MHTHLNIFSIENLVKADDAVLCLMTLLFLLICLLIGPHRSVYVYAVSSMYRFKNPDYDVQYPARAPAGAFLLSLVSCLSMALMVGSSFKVRFTEKQFPGILILWVCFILFLTLKMLLYRAVNVRLYNNQSVTLKPIRWKGFFIMAFSTAGLVSLIISAVAVFFSLPPVAVAICGILLLFFIEAGLIFKVKTALFRNKCGISVFFLYLCALEIVPALLLLVLLGKTVS